MSAALLQYKAISLAMNATNLDPPPCTVTFDAPVRQHSFILVFQIWRVNFDFIDVFGVPSVGATDSQGSHYFDAPGLWDGFKDSCMCASFAYTLSEGALTVSIPTDGIFQWWNWDQPPFNFIDAPFPPHLGDPALACNGVAVAAEFSGMYQSKGIFIESSGLAKSTFRWLGQASQKSQIDAGKFPTWAMAQSYGRTGSLSGSPNAQYHQRITSSPPIFPPNTLLPQETNAAVFPSTPKPKPLLVVSGHNTLNVPGPVPQFSPVPTPPSPKARWTAFDLSGTDAINLTTYGISYRLNPTVDECINVLPVWDYSPYEGGNPDLAQEQLIAFFSVSSTPPPTRQKPRDDNLSLGAARQRVGKGQPSSVQNSYRVGGRGTYS